MTTSHFSTADGSEYLLQPLREEADFICYRGTQQGNAKPILAVTIAPGQPSPQSLARLEHEYSLASQLDAAWAAQPLALTRHQGRPLLILKDPGGVPLDRIIEQQRGQQQDLARWLRIAVGLAVALGHVHRQGLIHKDVKPSNALVDDAGEVWLTGFGMASRLRRERQAPTVSEFVAGTLAYMSPEQTGRMNRSVDSRSDLYSLGITFYQMLTGTLPFTATDPLEWVHCHIARQPVVPATVPEALSAVIMRLLAKNADERYQTAAGVESDLRQCLAQWQSRGSIDPFPLSRDDSSDRLLIPEKLYGREHEVETLIRAFDRVASRGTAELVLVSGDPGIGKSSVVNELQKALVPPRGLFAAGKFDQYRHDVPYATLAQAFQTLVRQILVKSEAEAEGWRRTLLEALGPNGQLMVDLIPPLEFIIGRQPPLAELPAQEARGRFQLTFRRFLGAFARPEHPLALFLDDLQWLDAATLELLECVMTDPQVRHVLLIGAYRDNEVSSSHPLQQTLAMIRKAGVKVQEVALAPLGLDDVNRLIAEALHSQTHSVGGLGQLVYEKAGGNPFFAIQFLTALAEEAILEFDREAAGWRWDLHRIRARGYSDNVADLMLEKVRRLPQSTQIALQQLACHGNVANLSLLTLASGQSAEQVHASLWAAVRTALIVGLEDSYAFLHDRIQEAAYSLIPEQARPEVHLRIGRALLANLTANSLTEHLFEVASHLTRGAALLTDRDEKAQVAAIELRAGRKAKASAAYPAARSYFADGVALLDDQHWGDEYELAFNLWLERAECELLCGNSDKARQLIAQLLPRAATRVDEAAVYHLQIQLQLMKSEIQQAAATALSCLRGFGIDLPACPTEQQVRSEYEAVWQALDGRSIESLIDLPLMSDPELQAVVRVLSDLFAPAWLSDFNLACLQMCRMVQISLQHGVSGASAYAYASWIAGPGWLFHRYDEAYRFARVACSLVDKHGFIANQAKVYSSTGSAALWAQPTTTAIDLNKRAIRAAIETGDPVFACFPLAVTIPYCLLRNDPLDVLWLEAGAGLEFARKVQFGDIADILLSQQRFIATMQGRSAAFSTFSDAQFDETAFEARLNTGRMPLLVCTYWILKLEARFLSGDFAEALASAAKAQQSPKALACHSHLLDYYLYTALTVSALYESAGADDQKAWRELLEAHRQQLREWAESSPSTFTDKLALLSAEIARLERRDVDALRLYEEAIHAAREQGFVQNEGLAHELAAQFCLAHKLDAAGDGYLRNARSCYDRWGAQGKVGQLEARYPQLRGGRAAGSAATIARSAGQLDVETVVKASQAISSEILLPELIEQLVRIAVEHAGAERGLLILVRDGEPRIEAEATIGSGEIEVAARHAAITSSDLPQAVLHYTIRTQERVLLDDASADHLYLKDDYVRQRGSKSILCLPIVKQRQLVGALYLENNLAPFVFTADRVAVLQLLASQAAISLENARLYSDLALQAGLLQRLPVSAWTLDPDGTPDFVNQVWLEYSGQTLDFIRSHPEAWMTAVHPEDREAASAAFWEGVRSEQGFAIETRSRRAQDGSYRWHLQQAVVLRDAEGKILKFIGTTTDIDDQKHVEEALRQAQGDLARINRVTTMGELTASLAHELVQPISGTMINADTCLRSLARDPPDLDALHRSVSRIARDAQRASDVIGRIRSQFNKGTPNREVIDVNEITRETVALLRDEAARYQISVLTDLAANLPQIIGDRVQLQQVVMNLIVNGIEAMKDVDGIREMVFKSQRAENEQILVSVSDTGVGLPPHLVEQVFEAFFTTKPQGTGMGLRISRSIIESHSGRLWAVGASGRGATFHFSLPAAITGPSVPRT